MTKRTRTKRTPVAWECREHQVRKGDRCHVCADQLELFELAPRDAGRRRPYRA